MYVLEPGEYGYPFGGLPPVAVLHSGDTGEWD
jgi:hypothetical protein